MSMTVTGQVIRMVRITKKTGKVRKASPKVLSVMNGIAQLNNGHSIPEHFNAPYQVESGRYIFRYYN